MNPGTRIGPYHIVAPLGAGGMGEVYRARDSKLNREVAIKVLLPAVANDPDRLARFRREAQMLAALNHPNIAAIYGLEETGSVRALVMELVEGQTLAERIDELRAQGTGLPLVESMTIAAQIVDALQAAHDQGIVHRDLKPANIKVRDDGTVKVLDFGLAKALDASKPGDSGDLSMSPTITTPAMMTGIGTVLGTAAYMSPEQARGRAVDKRADIWAFGCVLYEMLSGARAFGGEDVAETIGAVIHKDPDWTRLPAATPPAVRTVLKRCLERDPKKRLRDISGVSLLLEDAPAPGRASRLPWIAAGAMGIVASFALSLWITSRESRPDPRPLVRLDVDLGADVFLGSQAGNDVTISVDGSRLSWVSGGRLFVRQLDQPKPVELAGPQNAASPFFSPDGRWVAFFSANKLRKVSVAGGTTITLCDATTGAGGSWGEDGHIIASLSGNNLSTIPDTGGTPAPLTEVLEGDPGDGLHAWPQILPGGHAVLFTVRPRTGSYDDARIDVLSIRDGHRKTLQRGGTFGRYFRAGNGDGYLLYINRGTLYAVPFDADRLEVRGAPSAILEGVKYSSTNGSAQVDGSRNGTLIYRGGSAGDALVTLQWLDANGGTELLAAKPAGYTQPRFSPDGSLIALTVAGEGGQDLWVYDWRRDNMKRLTFAAGGFKFPVWTPDGRNIVFSESFVSSGLFWIRADGAGAPQPLTQSKNAQFPYSFSRNGNRLAFNEAGPPNGTLWTAPVEKSDDGGLRIGKPEKFPQQPAGASDFSPDGRWIAYVTSESGTNEIQVRAFPDNGGKWSISNGGGTQPVWSPNGRELFYRTLDQRIMVVTYTVTGDVFLADKPRLWSEKRLAAITGRNFDVSPDGKRLVVTMPVDAPEEQKAVNHVVFLQNFSDEIRRRLAAAK